jgi:hypothetical protein
MNQTRGRPFQPGNTFGRGRPHGSRNNATIALQKLLDGHGEAITKKCALMALQGDPTALRLCMDRLLSPRKEQPVRFKVGPVTTAAEVAAAVSAVVQAVGGGQLTPAEGQMIAAILEGRRRVIETEEHERRLQELESGLSGRQPRPRARKGQGEPTV